MRIERLDHVNIHTGRLEETARFYEAAMGMTRGPAPGLDPDMTVWMFDDSGRPLIHLGMKGSILGEARSDADAPPGASAARPGSGAVHHIAFNCAGHESMLARLDALGVAYRCNLVTQIGLRQIFLHDPNGVLLELNFFGD